MTTEDDFRGARRARPGDWQTRLVFADWLQDRGDERAEGYRALGALRFHRERLHPRSMLWFRASAYEEATHDNLPDDWFELLRGYSSIEPDSWKQWDRDEGVRREAEDAAALAFARLPSARRRELLAHQPAGAP